MRLHSERMRPDDADRIRLDVRAAADYLDLPVSRLQKLLQKRELSQLWGEYQHLFRFDTSSSHIDSGSVL